MAMNRREFVEIMSAAVAAGLITGCSPNSLTKHSKTSVVGDKNFYDVENHGQVRLLHFTDCHAQLEPIYFREPNVNIGIGSAKGRPPHLVGQHLLDHFGIPRNSRLAHAFTYLNFAEDSEKYGKVGGFAHLRTLVNKLRTEYGTENTLLLDGGDTWQGSATSLWTRGQDMIKACNLLGVDAMTGHWEFTYKDEEVLANIERFKGEFLAQNVNVSDEAIFDDAPVYDEDSGHAFKPYSIKEMNGKRVAIIGQAFPYTPIANPKRFIPDWNFGIKDAEMQSIVDEVRGKGVDAVVVLSHNGMDVDVKMASQVSGIDAILGGHTHDGVPQPIIVQNPGGKTLVTNAGSNGKFLAVLDLDIRKGKVNGYQYKLLPIFSNLIKADEEMQTLIDTERAPYLDKLQVKLGVAEDTLYRRGNFNGTFDQVICDAQMEVGGAEISLSPGFRWGTSILPGQDITMEHLMDQTATTYPETYVRDMSGTDLKLIMEDIADNLFNTDPYYQQGGDMVRVGGMNYTIKPNESMGKRIESMTLNDGSLIEANKNYKVAGWGQVNSVAPGKPIWDIVAEYLKTHPQVKVKKLNEPKVIGMENNPGIV